jgi:hypothetical protein
MADGYRFIAAENRGRRRINVGNKEELIQKVLGEEMFSKIKIEPAKWE